MDREIVKDVQEILFTLSKNQFVSAELVIKKLYNNRRVSSELFELVEKVISTNTKP